MTTYLIGPKAKDVSTLTLPDLKNQFSSNRASPLYVSDGLGLRTNFIRLLENAANAYSHLAPRK